MTFETKLDSKELVFEATGTWWRIAFDSTDHLEGVQTHISKVVSEFELAFSRFNSKSAIQRLANGEKTVQVSGSNLLDFYEKLSAATDGLVTPAVGQQLVDAGYDPEYSLEAQEISDIPDWLDIVSWSETEITLTKPIQLDFGAAGKGALVDEVAEALSSTDWISINAGGDILCKGQQRIGLENPHDEKQVIGVVNIQDKAICASAPNRRDWGEYHHIIDPERKVSPRDEIVATWVVADSAMVADGLATALFLATPEALSGFEFEYAILRSDNTLKQSAGFKKLRAST